MKKIVTTNITTGAAAKIKSGTLEHLNEMSKEAISEVVASIVGESWDNTKCYILYGLENSGAGLNYIMTAGAIWYAGEVYIIPSQTITVGGGQILKFDYATSYTSAANADPVTFTDGSTHNIHKNTSGVWIGAATSASLLEYAYMRRIKDIYHYVGGGGIEPAFGAGWANSATYPGDSLRFWLNNDTVTIKGTVVKSGATSIFTLPVGYRPANPMYFFATNITACTIVGMYITTAGVVNITGSGAAATDCVIDMRFKI